MQVKGISQNKHDFLIKVRYVLCLSAGKNSPVRESIYWHMWSLLYDYLTENDITKKVYNESDSLEYAMLIPEKKQLNWKAYNVHLTITA